MPEPTHYGKLPLPTDNYLLGVFKPDSSDGHNFKKLASKSLSNFLSYTNSSVATPLSDSLRQTVHTHCASVHEAAKSVAALSLA